MNPNDIVMVIRREKAEELLNALSNKGELKDYIVLLEEMESLLAQALKK